jgi:hypothetical protein
MLGVLKWFLIQGQKRRDTLKSKIKKENGHFLNISGIDRSIEEWEIE